MTSKLRATLKGHKSAISRLFSKFDAIREDSADPALEDLKTLETALREKLKTVNHIHEQILDSLVEEDAVEEEIIDHDEYAFSVQSKIERVSSFYRATTSNLNANSTPFQLPVCESSVSDQLRVPPQTSHSSVYHRLPKLDLPTFNGDVLEWQSFWDSFDSAINSNLSLTNVQKFNYLKSLLRGEATQTIAGFALTNVNYDKAIQLLHERFGQKEKIINRYMTALLAVPAPVNTSTSLRKFYDTTETYIRGLDSLGKGENTYGALLTPVILQKLPQSTRTNITRAHGTESWCLCDLMSELSKEINILDAGNACSEQEGIFSTAAFLTKSRDRKPAANEPEITRHRDNSSKLVSTKTCVYCDGSHLSMDCVKVKDYEEKLSIVKRKKLCFNCLRNHKVQDCKSRFTCRKCSKRHHSSLCQGISTDKKPEITGTTDAHTSVLHSAHTATSGPVLLKTAVSMVKTHETSAIANILFDEGSQSSFVTQALAVKLNLHTTGSKSVQLSGFGDTQTHVRYLDTATIFLQTESEDVPINVLIVPEISVPLKTHQRHVGRLEYLSGLKLAHPVSSDEDFNIEVLIGADHYWSIVQDRIIRGNGPTAIASKIGYLLSGPLTMQTTSHGFPISIMKVITSHLEEEVDLEKFWRIESFGVEQPEPLSKEEEIHSFTRSYQDKCLDYKNQQYVAKLPWKDDHMSLPSNELLAKRRTVNVVRRLSKEPELLKKYGEIIKDQENRGFIEKISPDQLQTAGKVHYIPHHPVKKDSVTTPVRIVYDCSCRSTKDSPSLNDCLMSTPPQLNDLTAILLRFRLNEFAVCSDIEKAFLNVQLHADDRDVTRFFWLSDPGDPSSGLQTYRFKSVLFGATCSPFILNAVILKHLDLHPCKATELVRQGLYVDNILTSVPDENTLLEFYRDSRQIFQHAAFNLRSWNSNSRRLRETAKSEGTIDNDDETKVLGMRWDPRSDELAFPEHRPHGDSRLVTKREVLKQMSSVYDPLGLLSPVTVMGKMMMQSLWQQQFDWDEVLPENIISEWHALQHDLFATTSTKFSRRYFETPTTTDKDLALHVFTDASVKAYGACAYLVSGNQSSICMAKNRVAPLKQLTIPKLELCAALIGARLCNHVLTTIQCKNVYLWCDSMIVLSWISSTKVLPAFVANRVKEIHQHTEGFNWRYCPTHCNPADLLSRGLSYEKFRENSLWMHGPDWLTETTEFPEATIDHQLECPPSKQIMLNNAQEAECTTVYGILNVVCEHNYSSYNRLLRISAYVLRFISNCRKYGSRRGPLTTEELNNANIHVTRHVQQREFPEVVQYLHRPDKRAKPTLVRQLDLYLDDDQVIRCGGRLHNAPLRHCTRFPYLLPPRSHLTDLVIRNAHVTVLHSGTENTVTYLRQKFWIPKLRQRVRHIIRTCVTCRKVTSKPYQVPDPPPLPKDRLLEAPPFTVTGVDFTGALTVKSTNNELQKAYICLFTCANTRAIHLELVPTMTADSFILALRRFVSRKAMPKIMMSDNALAYIATAKILQEEILGKNAITWKFIPQHAPWYGGWWERLIGVTKTCIKKVLGKSLVSMEVLQTLITEVECIVNDRPLTYTSTDVRDDEPLTPSHLLYGRRITAPAYPVDGETQLEATMTHEQANKLHRFKSAILDRFWARWKHEYLTSLRQYHKKTGQRGDMVNIGDVVQIHDDVIPRTKWQMGVVEDLAVGRDGRVRAATVKSSRGVITRPIAKLYPLELRTEI